MARRTYDGPSCTSVTTFRESFPVSNSQELKCFETVDTTVRRACDGLSCRSVTEFRESISAPKFQIF